MDEDDVKAITDFLTRGIYPAGLSQDDKRTLRQKSSAFVCEPDTAGVVKLYHRGKEGRRQLVIYDATQKQEIMRSAHLDFSSTQPGRLSTSGGAPHNGINVTLRKISEYYWWRRLVEDVRTFCKNCGNCIHRLPVHMMPYEPVPDVVSSYCEDLSLNTSAMVPESHATPAVPAVQYVACHSSSFAADLLSTLNDLRDQQLLCDVVLASDDGLYQAHVHKIILIATSPYLRSLLLDSALTYSDYITLPNVSGECLKALVTFLYSGTLNLTTDSAPNIMSIAARLEMSTVADLCRNFIECPQKTESVQLADQKNGSDVEISMDCQQLAAEIEGICEAITSDDQTNFAGMIENTCDLSTPTKENVPHRSARIANRLARSVKPSAVIARSKEVKKQTTSRQGRRHNSAQNEAAVESRHSQSSDPEWKPDGLLSQSAHSHRYETRRLAKPTAAQGTTVKSSISKSTPTKLKLKFVNHETPTAVITPPTAPVGRWPLSKIVSKSPLLHQHLLQLATSRITMTKMFVRLVGPFCCQLCHVPAFRLRCYLAAHFIRKHREHFFSVANSHFKQLPCSRRQQQSNRKDLVTKKTVFIPKRSALSVGIHPSDSQRHSSQNKQDNISNVPMRNKCGWCGEKFETRSDLLRHRLDVHRKPKDTGTAPAAGTVEAKRVVVRDWICPEKGCGCHFKKKDKLRDHMAVVHPSVIFTCPHCRFKTQVEQILKRHLVRRHCERHSCHICGKAYHKPFLLRVHLFNRHKFADPCLKLHHCQHEGCRYTCATKHGMAQHVMKHVQSDAFSCHVCGKTFKRAAGLEKHVNKMHLGIRPYICDKCGMSCSDEPELKIHMTRHAENKPFTCHLCPFSTFQKGSLKSHLFCRHQVMMDGHMPVLRCDVCSFVTDKRCRYDDHVKMHLNIRDIPCPQCGKMFVTKKTLRQHTIKVHRRASKTATSSSVATQPTVSNNLNVVSSRNAAGDVDDEIYNAAELGNVNNFTSTSSFDPPRNEDQYNRLPIIVHPSISSPPGTIQYQMLMPLSSTNMTTSAATASSVHQMAVAVSAANPILIEIPLPVNNMAGYQTFQPFDVQNNQLIL